MLTTQQKVLLSSWLEEFSAVGKYELCWSSSYHGYQVFHQKCDGKPHTITIAKLQTKNEIYGGYTDVAWKSKHHFTISFLVEIDYLAF